MKSAAKCSVSTFGTVAAIAGLEHGIGEILQGSKPPESNFILSWPDSPFFSILAGEPAFTLIPNLLVSGILTVILALVFFAWVVLFIEEKFVGTGILLLSIALFLVGGGFGPPMVGVILGVAALSIHASQPGRAVTPASLRRFLGSQWHWLFACAVIAWLLLFPGINLLDTFVGVSDPERIVPIVAFSAIGLLLLTLTTGLARDSIRRELA